MNIKYNYTCIIFIAILLQITLATSAQTWRDYICQEMVYYAGTRFVVNYYYRGTAIPKNEYPAIVKVFRLVSKKNRTGKWKTKEVFIGKVKGTYIPGRASYATLYIDKVYKQLKL